MKCAERKIDVHKWLVYRWLWSLIESGFVFFL